jgi:hypothetical protein
MLALILLVFALVFCICEAFWPSWSIRARPHFGWLGMACLIAYLLFGSGAAVHLGRLSSAALTWLG